MLDRVVANGAPATVVAGAPLLPRELRSDRLTVVSAEKRGQFAELTYQVGPPTE